MEGRGQTLKVFDASRSSVSRASVGLLKGRTALLSILHYRGAVVRVGVSSVTATALARSQAPGDQNT